jgi:hypothetical protein
LYIIEQDVGKVEEETSDKIEKKGAEVWPLRPADDEEQKKEDLDLKLQ